MAGDKFISIRNAGRPRAEQRIVVDGRPASSCVVAPGAPGTELRVLVEA